MKTYRAKARGFDGIKVREPGETFQFEGTPGSWMEPVDVKAKKQGKAAKADEPETPEPEQPQKSASDQDVI